MMQETIIETEVTYTLEHEGQFILIEHVPARVCRETGEQLFSPDTVEHIQALINTGKKPDKVVETPVFEYV
jgi:YgiT-type zinc finger domain-containing protein